MTDGPQVHEAARGVLDYWFALTKEQHFAKDAARDREIAARFGRLRDEVLATEARGWRDTADTMLAAIILLDQFSRNIHRGAAEAFAADDLAAALAVEGIARGYDRTLPPDRAVFLLMPLVHAEDGPLQDLSVEKFEQLGVAENTAYARDHRAVFHRFGRFPGRNEALGRDTTPDEQAWLDETDGGW